MWVGLIQSVGFLTKNLTFPEGAGILPANCFWTELQLFPGSLACQPTLQIFDLPKAPTIMWISSLKSLPRPRPPSPLTHPSGPVPLRTLTTPFCYGQGLTLNSLGILPAYAKGETEVHVGWVTFSHLGARDGLKEGLNPGGEHWARLGASLCLCFSIPFLPWLLHRIHYFKNDPLSIFLNVFKQMWNQRTDCSVAHSRILAGQGLRAIISRWIVPWQLIRSILKLLSFLHGWMH